MAPLMNKRFVVACVSSFLLSQAHSQSQGSQTLTEMIERASQAASAGAQGQDNATRMFARFRDRNDADALKSLAELATRPGNHAAANFMGCIFGRGINLAKDENRAARYFMSGMAGSPLAAYNMGLIYAKAEQEENALRAMDMAWSRGGIEQAGAWLLTMRLHRRQDVSQLVKELDSIQSPLGQYHEALRLHRSGDHRGAISKLVNPISFGIVGSNGLMARIYLDAYVTSPSKFFDWAAGLSHLYIEKGVSSDKWGLPDKLPDSSVGGKREWFGDIYHQAAEVNTEAYARARQWFSGRQNRSDRYSVYLCEADRVFNRQANRIVHN